VRAYARARAREDTRTGTPPAPREPHPADAAETVGAATTTAATTALVGAPATAVGAALLAEHVHAHRVPPPRKVTRRVATAVDELLAEGIAAEHVRAGLALLRRRTHLSPALLPDLVHEAANPPAPPPPRRGGAFAALDAVDAHLAAGTHPIDTHLGGTHVIDGEAGG
jgi:hypothetical protein